MNYRERPYSLEEIERQTLRRELTDELLLELRDQNGSYVWKGKNHYDPDYKLSQAIDNDTPPEKKIGTDDIKTVLSSLAGKDTPEAWEVRSAILDTCRDFDEQKLNLLVTTLKEVKKSCHTFYEREKEKTIRT